MNSDKRLTLYELNSLVKDVIEYEMPDEYWVEAELSECRENRGHCYMELIQKDEQTATPIAKASARCWASKWILIRPYFERTTGQQLHAGMKVLLKVYAQFHEAYGFSWIVTDIDPTYTLGDMARKRQEIIRQLKEEGVFDLQKELRLPLFCQRIAVISSETAAGYGDFCNQLFDNPYGFKFETQLFPAIMQGEGVEQSIIAALGKIFSEYSEYSEYSDYSDSPFDCVVIIRGGGATSDMSGFDTLALAENVANFPLPIITGIGHERDESILDMVSHTRVKTPTAAATFLIDHLKTVLDSLNDAQEQIVRLAQQKLAYYKSQFATIAELLPRLFANVKVRQEARLDALNNQLVSAVREHILTHQSKIRTLEGRLPILLDRRLMTEKHRLQLLEEKAKNLDPALLLSRGYSMTMKDGKIVRDPQVLHQGDEIETRLEKGTIKSIVK
ncbi:MAG: exodeoxyribonuclease VII large subunit [Prevotella sp.]|nr:exodeoxyribonuclease VII large subunit [Prevotella sp.]